MPGPVADGGFHGTVCRYERVQGGLIVGLSGRNKLRGFVDEVRVDGLLAQVRLRIGDQILTAVVTADAVTELEVARGDRILGEVENLTPGLSGSFSIPLDPGTYDLLCPGGTTAAKGTLTVTEERPG